MKNKIVMENSQSQETIRVPIAAMDNSTSVNEHVCKLVLYMEIPSIKWEFNFILSLVINLNMSILVAGLKSSRVFIICLIQHQSLFFSYPFLVLKNLWFYRIKASTLRVAF